MEKEQWWLQNVQLGQVWGQSVQGRGWQLVSVPRLHGEWIFFSLFFSFFFSFFQDRASLCNLPWLSRSEGLFLVLINKHYTELGRLTIF